ncbi:phosphodiesterase [Saccharibacillus sp. CPCC 101409]|uniref:phosphodiesterase n=1 Tax=Saccharibacillus sp. CPCC 101409 TaxID=3058041 RepID=UPI0026713A90|nr:phosphodiesterase [Saccharibacillus sp. CPCC 101409]MDO3409298.1 phosphodiesterase [Saccharibacillus sp. CPCC 101409]
MNKLAVISDIHGSLTGLNRALERAELEGADRILLLGDYLYHGPRNPLPDGYDPQGAAAVLNGRKAQIALAVRGNCDAEVDQMLIDFPIMGEYAIALQEDRRIFATHGHHRHMDDLPELLSGDIFMQGHTHVPVAERRNGLYLFNPGSVSLPKEGYPPSLGILDREGLVVRGLDGAEIKRIGFA